MSDKTQLWDRLGKTDPKHTKGFKRAGGFSGTAIKPMWAIRRMTEEFGPCGEGWGTEAPQFQVVPAGDETLVFCTVGMWHGKTDSMVYGVGGDKCLAKRNSGNAFVDDEAFKKAYTDALTNAMKLIGVGADVHMGLFDDNKYVAEMNKEFSEPEIEIWEKANDKKKYLNSLLDFAVSEDALGVRQLWNELTNEQRLDLWASLKEFSTQRAAIKKLLDETKDEDRAA